MKEQLLFPKDFWWGAACSGPQSEGWNHKAHENLMDYWYRTRRNDFFEGVGPSVASDVFHHYKEDFKLMKSIGMNSYRTSIQWSRLIENLETGEISKEGYEFYKNLIQAAKEEGIELILNLYHFDLPIELQHAYGGWTSKHVTDLYAKYVKSAFEAFGKDVKYWTTFNEPLVMVDGGYLYGYHYPAFKNQGKEACQVMYNIALASAKAYKIYHEMDLGGEIGIILNLTPSIPKSESEEDQKAAEFADLFGSYFFMDTALAGKVPEKLEEILKKDGVIWKTNAEEEKIIADNKADFIGINYYHPKRVQARTTPFVNEGWLPDKYYEHYDLPNKRVNPYKDWEIYPKSLYNIAKIIDEKYGKIKWFVSENGMGVHNEGRFRNEEGIIEDQYRIDFYEEHLAWLYKAIQEGSSCKGYHAWANIDCWSWNNAYKNRYGFIEVDLNDQSRRKKKSAYWLKKLSDANGFLYDLENLK